jgi:hypothetical protein
MKNIVKKQRGLEGPRTVTKTKAADGSKSKSIVVIRNMKDGNTKVKSKTKSGGVVTKHKLSYGKAEPQNVTSLDRPGQMLVRLSVKGKNTVKNRNAKKGEVRKTKSKIDGAQTTWHRQQK